MSVAAREIILISTDKSTKKTGMKRIHIDKNATNAVEAYLEYKRSVCLGKIGKLKSIHVVGAKIFIIFN